MQYGEKCNILLNLINKTDYFWNFFYISTVAIFVTLLHENISSYNFMFKLLVSLIYLSFNVFNSFALIRCYKFLNAMCCEIKSEAQENFISPELIKVLKCLKYKHRIKYIYISYSLASIINLTLLWFGNLFYS